MLHCPVEHIHGTRQAATERLLSVLNGRWHLAPGNMLSSMMGSVYPQVGHIVGLGDRHGENILIDASSGDIVHVDFSCLFDRVRDLLASLSVYVHYVQMVDPTVCSNHDHASLQWPAHITACTRVCCRHADLLACRLRMRLSRENNSAHIRDPASTCFHVCVQGLTLELPEVVPFRLTQNLVDGFGVAGYEGVFRRAAEITLQARSSLSPWGPAPALLRLAEMPLHACLWSYRWPAGAHIKVMHM